MTDSKAGTRRTGPTPDAPEGYEYTPASAEIHRILGRRFGVIQPVAIDPERPGILLYHVGNFWDGPSMVRDNGDGSYTYTNPYNGYTDRFDAEGCWTKDGEHKPWSVPDAQPERPVYIRFIHEKGNPFRHRTEYPCNTLREAVEVLARELKEWADAFPELADSASALETSSRVNESGDVGTWDVGSTTYGIEERATKPPEGEPIGGYDLPPFGRVEFVPNVGFLAGAPGYVTTEPSGRRQWHSTCPDAERWLEQRGRSRGLDLQYFTLVRGPRGRIWYRTDSAQTGNRSFIDTEIARLREKYPDLSFDVGDSRTEYDVAPRKYRPWAK